MSGCAPWNGRTATTRSAARCPPGSPPSAGALDCLREQRRRQSSAPETLSEALADDSPEPEELLLRRERAERLRQALAQLGEADRRLFYRKYYYLQSTAQLAAELGTTERAVEGRLYRIKKRLRGLLGGEL